VLICFQIVNFSEIKVDKREYFFTVALSLIHKKGFKAMTLRELADVLQCDVSNVYNYVPNKQAILEEMLFRISGRFIQHIVPLSEANLPVAKKIESIIAHYVRMTVQFPYEVALLSQDWKQLKGPSMDAFLEEKRSVEHAIQLILLEGQAQGLIRPMPTDWLVHIFLSPLRWLFEGYLRQEIPLNPFELEQHLLDFITQGLYQSTS
jgi:TetR/AcrR family transcriptional regulator, cholesterol catabolism regulator